MELLVSTLALEAACRIDICHLRGEFMQAAAPRERRSAVKIALFAIKVNAQKAPPPDVGDQFLSPPVIRGEREKPGKPQFKRQFAGKLPTAPLLPARKYTDVGLWESHARAMIERQYYTAF